MARPLTRPRSPTCTRRRRSLASRRSRLSPLVKPGTKPAKPSKPKVTIFKPQVQVAPSADAMKTLAKTGSTTGAIVIAALFAANANPSTSRAFDSPCRWHIGVDGQHRPPLPCHFHSSLPPASPSPMFRPSPSCPPGLSVVLRHSTNQSSRVNRASSHPFRRASFPPPPLSSVSLSLHSFPPPPPRRHPLIWYTGTLRVQIAVIHNCMCEMVVFGL